jgi:hypothetical protein
LDLKTAFTQGKWCIAPHNILFLDYQHALQIGLCDPLKQKLSSANIQAPEFAAGGRASQKHDLPKNVI